VINNFTGGNKMLVNMNDVLYPAKKGKYAVGLFNAVNLELARGIIAAAESSQSPVIMGTAEVLLPYGPLEEVSYYLIPMAKKANVPVVIHLDHGLKKETCLKALELGFSSIMYDCSTDSYEDNVRKVKEMADIAHSYGATIEGELGHVGDNPDSAEGSSHINPADFYTDPKMAKDFVDKTGVDALCVWAYLALKAKRYRWIIYSWGYGDEVYDLIGYSYSEEYLNSEVRRYMEECLFENEHITGVQDLEVSQIKDVLHIKFTLVTDVGSKEVEMDV